MDIETRTPPIRAFSVIEEDENTGGIVFARHADRPGHVPAARQAMEGYGHGNRFIGPLKPYYTCCNGDREAFEAYAKATRVPA